MLNCTYLRLDLGKKSWLEDTNFRISIVFKGMEPDEIRDVQGVSPGTIQDLKMKELIRNSSNRKKKNNNNNKELLVRLEES